MTGGRSISSNVAARLPLMAWALLIVIVAAATKHARGDDPSMDTVSTLAVLRAGLEEWESAVEFACSFRFRSTYAATLEDGLAGRWDDSLAEGTFEASGEFYKMGQMVRYRLDYGAPPQEVAAPGSLPAGVSASTRVLTRISYDDVANGELVADYAFPHGPNDRTNLIHFNLRRDLPGITWKPFVAGKSSHGAFHPLNPMGNSAGSPLALWDSGAGSDPDALEIDEAPQGHLLVKMSKDDEQGREEREVSLWTEPSPPVVERVIERSRSKDGSVTRERHVILSGFVPCAGGVVAARAVAAKLSGTGRVTVQVWASDDIGKRQPKPADFVIRSEARTLVRGLPHPPPAVNGQRVFDMNRLRESDVSKKYVAELSPSEIQRTGPGANRQPWLLIANVTAAIVFVTAYLVLRRRRTPNG